MNDLMSGGFHRLWKDHLVQSLAPFAGQRHIDVAGGTGDVAFRVLRAIKDAERNLGGSKENTDEAVSCSGSVVVCDINAAMLEEGRRKAASQGVDTRGSIQWVEGNAECLPFENNEFDSYTIAFGIRNVTNRAAALREAWRILRPGGRFLCLEFSKVVVPGLQELYDLYSFNVIPEIGRVVAGDAESYRYLVESIRMFPGQEEFAQMIRDAGFTTVSYENLTAGVVAIHSGLKKKA
jgi:2-methoxy-6-polyprenyl-1,4-benzoquinol methylase